VGIKSLVCSKFLLRLFVDTICIGLCSGFVFKDLAMEEVLALSASCVSLYNELPFKYNL
jgi:hypothetical protein